MLAYRLIEVLIKRHHLNDRLHVLGYINKTKGYYTIYLTQDPASPLSSAFGYFNISLGNFRSTTDSEVYYYFNEFKDGKPEEDIVKKIEHMIGLPINNSKSEGYEDKKDISVESNMYIICVSVLTSIIQSMAKFETGFAIENEICPYLGPYSRVPDNNLWHELFHTVDSHGHDIKERCTYDYFAIGTGVPSGPVYRSWGFIANDGKVYGRNKEPFDIVASYNNGNSFEEIAGEVFDYLEQYKD